MPAEALGVAAGAIGIVGFAGQILDGVRKLTEFCSDVRGAPKELSDLLAELQYLAIQLARLQPAGTAVVGETQNDGDLEAYRRCQLAANDITSVVTHLESKLKGSGTWCTWAAIRSVVKKEDLEKAFRKLERAKTTLLIVQK